MKIVFILLFSFLINFSFSQSYVPFPDSNAYWTIESYPGAIGSYSQSTLYINGDTTINSLQYHKIYYHTVNNSIFYSGYRGTFRQDTASKKVFMIDSNINPTAEYLAYDFSLTVGDTFYLDSTNYKVFVVTVDDSVLVQGQFRRHLHLVPVYPICLCFCEPDWIEGFGSLYGYAPMWCSELGYQNLICFSENNLPVYPDTGTCDFITSAPEPISRPPSVTVYPNPFEEHIVCETTHTERISRITLTDVMGKVVLQNEIKFAENHHKQILETEFLKSGIYFLAVELDGKRRVIKLVK
jgi:hypothetical protein